MTTDDAPLILLLPAGTLVVSLLLTGLARKIALRYRILDHPNERSSHSQATPRGGGVAILAASSVFIAVGVLSGVIAGRDALAILPGLLVLGAVGWADDRGEVRPHIRLLLQLLAAGWTIYILGGLPSVRLGNASLPLGWLGYPLGVIGIVWSVNLFNFMDGIDGIAGSQAVLVFGSLGVMLTQMGSASLAAIALTLAAGSAGFLAWNWPPARIFMGDVGSGPLGYAAAALAISSERANAAPLLVVGIVAGVFSLDATVTLVRRVARGKNPAEAHRDHAYQRLARLWNSHRRVTASAAAVTLILIVLAAIGNAAPRLMIGMLAVSYALLGLLFFAIEKKAPM